ncbi:hypothetical protein C3432_13250 [Citrobacter amalonaticus]|uniref:Uncharacterized protein n=1 Tax=Citrobacter amalonaticus TaxID=35703 RepID=A0A2S4RVY5_CITAM|nr:hypothetical protein C3432_13250 [Citrobacter amalonaticus]POT74912.1 hypothetical protein C3436_13720 [Citrobacter amalonaticus]POU64441.1 hypothetical protein C3430_14740 [Citrobacter amalonaticus]POV04277.1 hypothetical protein C3424_14060 [Citrobacter amalonaticus]
MASHSVKPKFSRYTQLQPDFIVVDNVDANAAEQTPRRWRTLIHFILQAAFCWLRSFIPGLYDSDITRDSFTCRRNAA